MGETSTPRRYRLAIAGWPGSLRAASGLLAVTAAAWTVAGGYAGAAVASSRPVDSGSWTVYHHDAAGSGIAAPVTAVETTRRAWTSPRLDGQIYGEPLVWAGRVYVATENDTVYALSSASGTVVWSAHLGAPVPAGSLPCGNIAPAVGITGTPVIDPARGEIFVVAEELVNGKPAHLLAGLAAATGKREMSQDVDPAGADTGALLQRTGLTLDAGQVVFGFGGNFGDCAAYRGRLVAVSEAGGTPTDFTVDAAGGESQGAIWMGGAAPAVDASGHLWVGVGNGSVTSAGGPYDYSDSVLELSSALRLLQFFAPGSWPSDNAHDLDMSTEPALLADGQVVAAGKSRIAYLLSGAHLGGVGGQRAALGSVCSDDVDGGTAVTGTTVYLPCASGIIAVRAARSPAALRLLWSSGTGGGPPIVAAGLVWTIGQNGTLYGLDPATGKVRQRASIGVPANHFPTPSAGGGLLLAPSATRVVAFAAPAPGASASPAPTPVTKPATAGSPGTIRATPAASHPASPPEAASGGGARLAVIAVIAAGCLAAASGIGWLRWRRRPGRRSGGKHGRG
jgi:outer membrane protein assembly factor BamB